MRKHTVKTIALAAVVVLGYELYKSKTGSGAGTGKAF